MVLLLIAGELAKHLAHQHMHLPDEGEGIALGGDFFEGQNIGQRIDTAAAIFLRDQNTGHAEIRPFAPQLVRKFVVRIHLKLHRGDLGAGEIPGQVLNFLLLRGKRKIHATLSILPIEHLLEFI